MRNDWLNSAYLFGPAPSLYTYCPGNIYEGWFRVNPRPVGRISTMGGSHCQRRGFMYAFEHLYCIVLYLYIYRALLAVHTNQKRFQCERAREKRAVLRERKEALGSPVNKVDWVEGRSWASMFRAIIIIIDGQILMADEGAHYIDGGLKPP